MIQGKNRFDILEQLRKDKTLIKMRLLDSDYEQLTIIIDIRGQKKHAFFSHRLS